MPESREGDKPYIEHVDRRIGGGSLYVLHRHRLFLVDVTELAPGCWAAAEVFVRSDTGWFDLDLHPLCACASTVHEAIIVALAEIEELDEPLELVDPISPEEAARLINSAFELEAAE